MERLTDQGWQKVLDLAQRYGVSTDAVQSLLQAVANGGGTMAQFFHNELGGGGQWMQGGMTMVGDMFNSGLKAKVDGLCSELSQLLQTRPFVPPPPPSSAFRPGGQQQSQGSWGGSSSFFGSGSGSWWPSELGSPNGSGGQNNIRYAYFNQARRLAVDVGGNVTVYDTLDHQIGGVQQQQGGNASVSFSSQYGTFDASSLPVVSVNGVPTQSSSGGNANAYSPPQYNPPPPPPVSNFSPLYGSPPPSSSSFAGGANAQEADVFAKIERLAELQQKGILSLDEFTAKKAELLSRL